MNGHNSFHIVSLAAALVLATGCSDELNEVQSGEVARNLIPEWVFLFDKNALQSEPKMVDCVLSGGTRARCVSLTVPAAPTTISLGPWCPRNVSDGADAGGIWLESGQVYEVDGEFIKNLATFYNDSTWQLYDDSTGNINVTDSRASCQAAARPDVDEAYQNYCVECQISYLEDGKSQTFVIPVEAVPTDNKLPRVGHDGVGVALSGVRLDAPAPTDAILSAHTLAPFDDCGGHVNLVVGYHMHAITDCLHEFVSDTGHAPMLGVALDGYAIHSRLNQDDSEPSDLDSCRGHYMAELGYHYHAGAAGSNAIIGCHSAQTGCVLDGEATDCDATESQPRGGPGRRSPPPLQNN